MKITEMDKNILSYLYQSKRESISKISKDLHIHRNKVEYSLKKFEDNKIIKQYIQIINFNKLGYNESILLWIKVKQNKDEIYNELQKIPQVISVGKVLTKYDFYVNIICKNKEEFEKIFQNFLKKYDNDIQNHDILINTYFNLYPLQIFGNLKQIKNFEIIKESDEIKISDNEIKILKELESNSRKKLIDIAKNTNQSIELTKYHLDELYKKEILLGTRINFDLEKLGYYFGLLRIKLKNTSDELKKEIETFLKKLPNTISLAVGIGVFNCHVQFFYKNEKDLREMINLFLSEFDNKIIDSELLLNEKESEVKILPF